MLNFLFSLPSGAKMLVVALVAGIIISIFKKLAKFGITLAVLTILVIVIFRLLDL